PTPPLRTHSYPLSLHDALPISVSADVVRSLLGQFRESGAPVVIPTFQNRRGHPVLIARTLFPELLSLDAAEGANTVIRRYGHAADRKSTRLNSSHLVISYAVFC